MMLFRKSTELTDEEQIEKLCSAINIREQSIRPHLLSATNKINNEGYAQKFIQQCLPLLVNAPFKPNSMSYRQTVILFNKLVSSVTNCDVLMVEGFIDFVKQAAKNEHACISIPACNTIVKLIVYSTICQTTSEDLFSDPFILISAIKSGISTFDTQQQLDAIRALTFLKSKMNVSPDLEMCDILTSLFCNSSTPFVTKQVAELITYLSKDDPEFQEKALCFISEIVTEDKPLPAARCWEEVTYLINLSKSFV